MEKPQSLTQRLRDSAAQLRASGCDLLSDEMYGGATAIEELVAALEALLSGGLGVTNVRKADAVLAKYGSRHDNTPNDVSTNGAERE